MDNEGINVNTGTGVNSGANDGGISVGNNDSGVNVGGDVNTGGGVNVGGDVNTGGGVNVGGDIGIETGGGEGGSTGIDVSGGNQGSNTGTNANSDPIKTATQSQWTDLINRVKNAGGVTELTSADYDYPTSNPDGIALWLLEPGVYTIKQGVKYYQSSSQSDTTSVTLVIGNDTSTYSPSGGGTIPVLAIKNTGTSGQIFEEWVFNPRFDSFTSQRVMPTISQSTGISTSSVMSQNATTSMVFADPSTRRKVQIGVDAEAGNYGLAIGYSGKATGEFSIALGGYNVASGIGAMAFGRGASATQRGQVDFGTSVSVYGYNLTNYRLLTGLYDPQSAHDAATKGYVDPTTDSSAPTTATVGRLGQIQIDTTTNTAYMCVAVDNVTPAYTWKQITA